MSCLALTKKGKQCSRKQKVGVLCTQHSKCKSITFIHEQEPWEAKNISPPDPRNGKEILQKIRVLLKKGPTKKDKPGHIYVYYLDRDQKQGLSYYKIGRTTQAVETRISQWKDAKLKHSWSVKNNICCERLIHLCLTYCRIHRYKHKNGYHSIYQESREVLDDPQRNDELKLRAVNKNVEWFAEEWETIEKIIKEVAVVVF